MQPTPRRIMPPKQPQRLQIADPDTFEMSRGAYLVEVAPDVEAQHVAWMEARRPVVAATVRLKPTRSAGNKCIDGRTRASRVTGSSESNNNYAVSPLTGTAISLSRPFDFLKDADERPETGRNISSSWVVEA